MKVSLFIPCFVDQFFPDTARNMVKILQQVGCEIDYNPNQTCCAQPAFNAGFWQEATKVASKFVKDFENAPIIVCPSGSCVGFIRNHYVKLFENQPTLQKESANLSPKIYELTEFLVNVLQVEDLGATFNGTATYHDSCGALRECGIKDAPRKLLANVKGLQLQESHECETCCGFGGTFAVKFEAISTAMAEKKTENILASTQNVDYLISTDLSCLMHLDGYLKKHNIPLKTLHIADILASD
ncbi:MAG: (Fe-S)-binding protein [Chitinophagales bacterium]